MSADQIELWHKRARPSPTAADFNVQLGCHFEELEEMMRAIKVDDAELWEDVRLQVLSVSRLLKANLMKATITNRKELLDSLADQAVTGIGVGQCAGMKTAEAINRVDSSNWSKFDDNGMPIFNEQGKVMKGPNYSPPDLEGLY
jgi:hypothetical protein